MRVAIYCRLSEEDKNKRLETDDSGSIQNQKTMLLQYAAEQGWELYRVYSDDDYAGADRRRPEFNRLLSDAEQRRFDIVLCKTQSRFTRELELVEKYIHGLFPVWGIRFVSIVDGADTESRANKKSRQINGLVNEWYLEDMSENIRSVLTNRRKNGLHIGAFALYGYKKDPAVKGHLLIDEEAAAVVREVFTLFAQGYGKTAIARMLNYRGVPNPTEYKRLHGLRYRQPSSPNSTLWRYSSISDMLTNEIYAGNMVQGRYGSVSYKTKQNRPRPKSEWYVVEGTHEAIIDKDLWDRVQALIAQRARPFNSGKIGLFSGKARCANCGYTMRSSWSHGRRYLQCPLRHVSKDACPGSFISSQRLETLVSCELGRLSAQHLGGEELARRVGLCADSDRQEARIRAAIAALQKRASEYSKGIRELYLDKMRGVISQGDYADMTAEFSSERDRLSLAIEEQARQLALLEQRRETERSLRELIEWHASHLSREIVETLIDYISVGRRIPGTKDVPVEIHWNF